MLQDLTRDGHPSFHQSNQGTKSQQGETGIWTYNKQSLVERTDPWRPSCIIFEWKAIQREKRAWEKMHIGKATSGGCSMSVYLWFEGKTCKELPGGDVGLAVFLFPRGAFLEVSLTSTGQQHINKSIDPLRTICKRKEHMRSGTANMDLREDVQNSILLNSAGEISFRRELYPPIEPYSSGFLNVSDLHSLYWEQSGNPDGHPVVFLHGGPGGGTSTGNRRFFDPEFFRIILFDQRGAGKSRPGACLEENTTWDLVDDIEKIRKHLGIEEWQVFGGSWGSTLSLAYAQSYPEHVTGLVIRGIFLLRKKEIDWFYEGGISAIYPDAWESFRDFIPEEERADFITAYNKRLNSSDPEIQKKAAKIWTTFEMVTSYLLPNEDSLKRGEDDGFALAFARIENHYFKNKGFFPTDSFLLDNVDKIRHIPATIVQGRYDVVCPMMSAWDLHKAWPEAEFKVVLDAGHSANEPGITAELVAANERLKELLKQGK